MSPYVTCVVLILTSRYNFKHGEPGECLQMLDCLAQAINILQNITHPCEQFIKKVMMPDGF